MKPFLIITIDTEEGFDWYAPFRRDGFITRSLFDHDLYMTGFYSAYNIRPISLISYPLLDDTDCQRLLKKYSHEKRYLLGTHLHSWVTPPYTEELSNYNSYAHNLPSDLKYQKFKNLTDKFIDVLGYQPLYFKAGRYGIAQRGYEYLKKLGYRYDFSPFAKRDFSYKDGPDFTHIDNKPFLPLSDNSVTAYPATADYVGLLKHSHFFQQLLNYRPFIKLKGRAILARLKLLNFIPLTPEGVTEQEMKDLTRCLLSQGQKYFHLSYHSSSFTLNGSPYSQSEKAIKNNEEKLKNYIHFFQDIGGITNISQDDVAKIIDNV